MSDWRNRQVKQRFLRKILVYESSGNFDWISYLIVLNLYPELLLHKEEEIEIEIK